MFSDLEKMAALRAKKTELNLDIKPVDLFRAAAYEVASGADHYDNVLIIARRMIGPNPDFGYEYSTWRCCVTREQETTMLVVAQDINVRKLRGG